MPEDPPVTPSSVPPAMPQPAPPTTGTTFNIGEEFGTAKRNLPPAKMVVPAVAAVLLVVAIVVFVQRAKPPASGSLDNVTATELPGNTSTMAALTFTVKNSDKLIYVRSIQGKLKTAKGEYTGEAVSAVDFDRFFQAFPVLKNGTQPALAPEAKLQPEESVSRSVIVTFPVALDEFNQRQSVSVVIQPYDQAAVVLTK